MTTKFNREPEAEWYLDTLMRWHVLGPDSGGTLALGEAVVRPGSEPPIHIHAREEETWHVLEGRVLFQRGLERFECGPGQTAFLPRGIPHGFAVRTASARMLHLYTPAGLEGAFRSLSVAAPGPGMPPPRTGPPEAAEMARVEQTFAEHGITFVGPPLPVVLAPE
jgi:quercetin dioxygenase-like cupin family protein